MTTISKLLCGITILTVPTIAYGGYFLLTMLSGVSKVQLTDFQRSMFRAGHAHAGVLVILDIIAQLLTDYTQMGASLSITVRLAFPFSTMLISGGFFAAAAGNGLTQPNRFINLLYAGVLLLVTALITLGLSLITSR